MGIKGTDSCLAKVKHDEPIFVLRAQDLTAPGIVRAWANMARKVGCPETKIKEAFQLADRMEEWAKSNGGKMPD